MRWSQTEGPCGYMVEGPGWIRPCREPGAGVRVDDLPAGRPMVREEYCPLHGGRAAAEKRVRRAWTVLAPESVGDAGAVELAGAAMLTSTARYVVIRHRLWVRRASVHLTLTVEAFEAVSRTMLGRVWRGRSRTVTPKGWREAVQAVRVALGRGMAEWQAEADDEAVKALADVIQVQHAPDHTENTWTVTLGIGGYTRGVGDRPTQEEALALGMAEWQAEVDRQVAAITAARGGDLSWGAAFKVPDAPVVLYPAEGQSAWAMVAELREQLKKLMRQPAENTGPDLWAQHDLVDPEEWDRATKPLLGREP